MITVRLRIFAREPRGDERQLRLHAFERASAADASDGSDVTCRAAWRCFGIEYNRRPDLRAVRKGKSRRHDPDDLVRLAVENNRPSNHRPISIKAPPPQCITDDHDVMTTKRLVVADERSAER